MVFGVGRILSFSARHTQSLQAWLQQLQFEHPKGAQKGPTNKTGTHRARDCVLINCILFATSALCPFAFRGADRRQTEAIRVAAWRAADLVQLKALRFSKREGTPDGGGGPAAIRDYMRPLARHQVLHISREDSLDRMPPQTSPSAA